MPKIKVRDLTDTIGELVLLYCISMLIFAFLFSLFEKCSLSLALWWTVVTSTTVGYGDVTPVTLPGRTLASALMHISNFVLTPLITARIAAHLIVQDDAFTHTEQENIRLSLENIQRDITAMKSIQEKTAANDE